MSLNYSPDMIISDTVMGFVMYLSLRTPCVLMNNRAAIVNRSDDSGGCYFSGNFVANSMFYPFWQSKLKYISAQVCSYLCVQD